MVGRSGDTDIYSFHVDAGESVSAGLKFWTAAQPYGPRTDYADYTPASVALGDVNNDGKLDMVDASIYGWDFRTRLGNGDGTFNPSPNSYTGSGRLPEQGRPRRRQQRRQPRYGRLDVGWRLVVRVQRRGHARPRRRHLRGSQPYYAGHDNSSIAVADVNGDSKPDIVTTNLSEWTVNVLFNNGNGTFGAKPSTPRALTR